MTSRRPFERRGEVFGDDVAAAAMIDRLVHHAEVARGPYFAAGDAVLSPGPIRSVRAHSAALDANSDRMGSEPEVAGVWGIVALGHPKWVEVREDLLQAAIEEFFAE